ncbi:MAG: hypothetical protein U0235_00135 [Polyangiaceae bacterium]
MALELEHLLLAGRVARDVLLKAIGALDRCVPPRPTAASSLSGPTVIVPRTLDQTPHEYW